MMDNDIIKRKAAPLGASFCTACHASGDFTASTAKSISKLLSLMACAALIVGFLGSGSLLLAFGAVAALAYGTIAPNKVRCDTCGSADVVPSSAPVSRDYFAALNQRRR